MWGWESRAGCARIVVLALLLGCEGSPAPDEPAPVLEDLELTAAMYRRVAATPAVVSWRGDLVTTCRAARGTTEVETFDPSRQVCEVRTIDRAGVLSPTPFGNARIAERLPDGRALLLRPSGELVLVGPDGADEEPLGSGVLSAHASRDGAHLAYVRQASAADPRELVLAPLGGVALVLGQDDYAAELWPAPDGSRALLASRRGGVPALYVLAPGGAEPRRLTNGEVRSSRDRLFVPLPTAGLAWSHDGASVLFAGALGGEAPDVYSLPLATGELRRLGPGRYPQLYRGAVFAVVGAAPADATVYRYTAGGRVTRGLR